MPGKILDLFGGDEPWSPVDWTDSDDRVRGGKSQSYFSGSPFEPVARFYGNLDIDTLGGAGFASQRTTGERSINLGGYAGIELQIEKSDSKRYTLNLKDALLSPDPSTGREQSSISYEYDFTIDEETARGDCTTLKIPWSAFKATYRGKEKPEAPALDTKNVKRLSIMMRSFFGTQDGPFSISIRSISAYVDDDSDSSRSGLFQYRSVPVPALAALGATLVMVGVLARYVPRSSL